MYTIFRCSCAAFFIDTLGFWYHNPSSEVLRMSKAHFYSQFRKILPFIVFYQFRQLFSVFVRMLVLRPTCSSACQSACLSACSSACSSVCSSACLSALFVRLVRPPCSPYFRVIPWSRLMRADTRLAPENVDLRSKRRRCEAPEHVRCRWPRCLRRQRTSMSL